MPMPRWWTRINKRVFNPRELKRGKRPVLVHTGRTSGLTHHTPLEVQAFDGGYVVTLVYGAESDWVRNVLAAGRARLRIDGEEVELSNPRVIDGEEAFRVLPEGARRPPRLLRIDEFLRVDAPGR